MFDFDRVAFANFGQFLSLNVGWLIKAWRWFRRRIKQFQSPWYRSTPMAFALHDVLIDFISLKTITYCSHGAFMNDAGCFLCLFVKSEALKAVMKRFSFGASYSTIPWRERDVTDDPLQHFFGFLIVASTLSEVSSFSGRRMYLVNYLNIPVEQFSGQCLPATHGRQLHKAALSSGRYSNSLFREKIEIAHSKRE